jgi:hypothetical protein
MTKFTATSTKLQWPPRRSSYHPRYIFDLMLLPIAKSHVAHLHGRGHVHAHRHMHGRPAADCMHNALDLVSIDTYL